MDSEPDSTAAAILGLRDRALAALDAGQPALALGLSAQALVMLATRGLRGGLDEAAVLIARAEIQEALDQFAGARATITAANAILADSLTGDADEDSVALWCQAQERTAGLERLAGDHSAAAARLGAVLDRAAAVLGEASVPVASAASALGVVHKYSADFDAAETAYQRAAAAVAGMTAPDPLLEAGLLHNRGGLAHSRGDAAAGIPLAERGLALRRDALGPHHPDVARDLNALGALYHLAGRPGEAATAYQQALATFEESYGPAHLEVAMTCANLAVLHGDQGNDARAETLGCRSLGILTALLGPDDPEVGLTLLNLAAAAAGQQQPALARERASRAAVILAGRLPADHPHVLAATQAARRYGDPA